LRFSFLTTDATLLIFILFSSPSINSDRVTAIARLLAEFGQNSSRVLEILAVLNKVL